MLEIQNKKIEDLIPYVNNARVHSDEQVLQIASSIKEFGFNNPILLDGKNGVIAGHGRLLAAQKLNLTEVPTIELAHLSEAQKKAYILADNKMAENAKWDKELLGLELAELQALDSDLLLTGFSDDELASLVHIEGKSGHTEDDAVPDEKDIATRVNKGDVWVLGEHRLMCGDSTDKGCVEKLMNGLKADMWLTDPPYNVDYTGKTKDALKIDNDSMNQDDFRHFLRDCYSAADNVLKPGAVFYIWHADSEGYNFRGAAVDIGWKVRQCLIWKKNSLVMGQQDYHWKHEPCLYGWKGGAGHLWATDRKQTTILEFNKPSRNDVHPTMKPVALFEYLLLNNTKGGDIVLDSFAGSGTTGIAAEKHGRKAYLMETDPKYCDAIIQRWEDFTHEKAALELRT